MENPPNIIINQENPAPPSVNEIIGKMNDLDLETELREKEALFKQEISRGKALSQDGSFF